MKKLTLISLLIFFVACSDQASKSKIEIKRQVGLSLDHKREFEPQVIKVTDDVYSGVGYGLANSIMVETKDGLVIIDTLGSEENASVLLSEFRKISTKPVKAIIYTHNHLDHLGGATIFAADDSPDIYAQENILYNIDNIATTIRPIIFERSARQFGIPLSESDIVHQGIGAFLEVSADSTLGLLRPTITFKDKLNIKVGELEIELVHAPGETDDHLFVWLPKQEVVMVGDNFYRSFANLYAIRGTKFRNPMDWINSLDKIRKLDAEHLIPSHSRPLSGKKNIEGALRDYRDGIQFVHDQTIRHINKGLMPDEIVQKVKLPNHLSTSPYLQEFYGSISSYVRSIFSGYIGWFSGNITDLHPMELQVRANKMSELANNNIKIIDAAIAALDNGEYQWAMELADILIILDENDKKAKEIKARAAENFSFTQSASNDYYFYQTVAGELRNEFDIHASESKTTPEQIKSIPMKSIMKSLPVNLNFEKAINVDKKILFTFHDLNEVFRLHIRRGVAELSFTSYGDEELIIKTNEQIMKEVFAGLKNAASISLLLANNEIEVKGGKIEFLKILSLFKD